MGKFLEAWKRLAGKGVYPPEFAWMLLAPWRGLFQSPKKLARMMGLKEDSKVLEIGPGGGYFSPGIAKAVPKGKLYITDIQQEMLDLTKKRMLKKKAPEADFRLCDGRALPYDSGMFDFVCLVTVLGEIEDQDAYLKEIYRVLKKDGVLSISESWGDPDNLTLDQTFKLLGKYGFRLDRNFGKGNAYTANFKK